MSQLSILDPPPYDMAAAQMPVADMPATLEGWSGLALAEALEQAVLLQGARDAAWLRRQAQRLESVMRKLTPTCDSDSCDGGLENVRQTLSDVIAACLSRAEGCGLEIPPSSE